MDDGAEGVHLVPVEQDVDLDQVGVLGAVRLVVQGGVAAGARLQGVEEVEDDLRQRQHVVHLHAGLGEVVHALHGAATRLAQLHDRAHELAGGQDRGPHHRLGDGGDLALGELAGVGHRVRAAVLHRHLVDHGGGGGDDVQVELALQALADDLQVQQAQVAAAEAEAQGHGGLRLIGQGGVVELELVQGVAQGREVRAVHREQAGEDHGLGVLVSRQGLVGRGRRGGDRVTDLGLAHVLDPGDEVADLAGPQPRRRRGLGADDADLQQVVDGLGGEHLDALAGLEGAVDDAHVGDHAAVGVVDGVEDHGAGRGLGVAVRGRDGLDDPVEQLGHALAGLARDLEDVVDVAADEGGDLLGVLLRLGGGQVDLVEDRDDGQVPLDGHVEVGQGLGLDALGGVDQEDRALAGGQGAVDLVGEVDVPGGVDHVEGVGARDAVVALEGPGHAHGLGLDGDAALALDVHAVQVLGTHVTGLDDAGGLEHAVGQGGLAVVDVRDDAEVAQPGLLGGGGLDAGHLLWCGDR